MENSILHTGLIFQFSSLGQKLLSNSKKARPSDVFPEKGSQSLGSARHHGQAGQSSAGTKGFSLARVAEAEATRGGARETFPGPSPSVGPGRADLAPREWAGFQNLLVDVMGELNLCRCL